MKINNELYHGIKELNAGDSCYFLMKLDNHSILGYPDALNENLIPFFQIRKFDNNGNIVGICRLSLYKPEYIVGYDENIILTNEEKEKIINFFKTKKESIIDKYNNLTGWQYSIRRINGEYEAGGWYNKMISESLPMPDYNLLKTED